MKKQQGITLIALVITIIVMLILVGVTITLALNGGLIGKAQDAKAQWNSSQESENALDFNYDPATGEITPASGGSSVPALSITVYSDFPGDSQRPDITLSYSEGWTWGDVVAYYTANPELNTYNLNILGNTIDFTFDDFDFMIWDTSEHNYGVSQTDSIHSDAHYIYSK